MIRLINILFFSLLLISQLSSASFKKYAGEFLALGAGSRAMGLGGAFVAMADDASASYWNPAGLVDASGFELQFMHTKQFISSIQHNFLAASLKLNDRSALALSVMYLTINGIKDTREAYNFADGKIDYSKIRSFNTGDYVMYLSYAKWYNEKFSYGFNVKLMQRDYKVESGIGVGFDVGLKYRLAKNFLVGVMFRDVTTSLLTWSTGTKELITPSIRAGASYIFTINRLNLSFQPALDFNFLFENRNYAAQQHLGTISLDTFAGMEAVYSNLLAVRLGLDDLNRFNTGVGVQIPKISFDYSFTSYQSELDDIHRISVHLKFDRTIL